MCAAIYDPQIFHLLFVDFQQPQQSKDWSNQHLMEDCIHNYLLVLVDLAKQSYFQVGLSIDEQSYSCDIELHEDCTLQIIHHALHHREIIYIAQQRSTRKWIKLNIDDTCKNNGQYSGCGVFFAMLMGGGSNGTSRIFVTLCMPKYQECTLAWIW